jgi:diguanylate cyclase (GGDEF)-like protein
LLPETGIEEAYAFADRLRVLVSEETEKLQGGKAPTTISVGLSYMSAAGSMMDALRQADLALYEAKRTGRNKVCCFDPKMVAKL